MSMRRFMRLAGAVGLAGIGGDIAADQGRRLAAQGRHQEALALSAVGPFLGIMAWRMSLAAKKNPDGWEALAGMVGLGWVLSKAAATNLPPVPYRP